jgi:hypothetical protein
MSSSEPDKIGNAAGDTVVMIPEGTGSRHMAILGGSGVLSLSGKAIAGRIKAIGARPLGMSASLGAAVTEGVAASGARGGRAVGLGVTSVAWEPETTGDSWAKAPQSVAASNAPVKIRGHPFFIFVLLCLLAYR